MLQVMKRRCDQCLFGANKIVSEARKKELLKDIRRKETYFICHKSTLAGGEACCRGFYDAKAGESRIIRMAQAFEVVEFVEVVPVQQEEEA